MISVLILNIASTVNYLLDFLNWQQMQYLFRYYS